MLSNTLNSAFKNSPIISLFLLQVLLISPFLNPVINAQSLDTGILESEFSNQSINVDGLVDKQWEKAKAYEIIKTYSADLSHQSKILITSASVKSMWDGASLYLLISVKDNEVNTTPEKIPDKDGIAIYFDLFNDKFPKYFEDDGIWHIAADGETMVRGTDTNRFEKSAVTAILNNNGKQIGYNVELKIRIGGIRKENGTSVGMELVIQDSDANSTTPQRKIFWHSVIRNDWHDNSNWGTVQLTGYQTGQTKALDNFILEKNLNKAREITPGIWKDEITLKSAIKQAENAIEKSNQTEIDLANASLEQALYALRRDGPLPDPYELPIINHLPDPFSFQNGKRVISSADWAKRTEEIKTLTQYYEYGKMPEPPEEVTATLNDNKLLVNIQDKGKTASFEAQLTLPEPSKMVFDKAPVIVSIDFFIRPADSIYLNAGYAVLNFRYTSVASDNNEHTGPFYELYPYDIASGQDAGTLLAWAWGASRCVDALEFLNKNDTSISNKLDLNKIAVTGFSRCGKAALAAGLFDQRFGVVNPGASGCGGAAVFRYASFGGPPKRQNEYGNIYPWGQSPGCEVLPDKIRHQGHNSNAMLPRLLDQHRIYNTSTYGYGERLPYDHHEIIAAISPRGVLITTANDDYANNAEGDALGLAGAKPVFEFLGVGNNLALNLRTTGEPHPRWSWAGGHWVSNDQKQNLIHFCNYIFYKTTLPSDVAQLFYENPYEFTIDKYYGGWNEMMPWLKEISETAGK